MHRIFSAATLLQLKSECKGRYKKSTPKVGRKNSAYSAKTPQFLRKPPQIFRVLRENSALLFHPRSAEIIGRKIEFGLKIIKDDGSFGV